MGLHAPGPWQLTSPRSPTFLSGALRARSGLQSHRVDVNSSLCVLKRRGLLSSSWCFMVLSSSGKVYQFRANSLLAPEGISTSVTVLRKSLLLVHVT